MSGMARMVFYEAFDIKYMNICVLTHTFPRNEEDTAAAFMKGFSDGLVRAGNKVIVVTPFDLDFDWEKDKFKIVKYRYIWPDSWHVMGYSRTMKADVSLKIVNFLLLPFMILFGTIALIRTINKEKIDIVNVHWILPNGVIAFLAYIITGVQYVVTLPGTDAFLAFKNKAFGLVAKVIAARSSGLVSNSSWLLKRILALGVGEKPTEIINYPTDISEFKPQHNGVEKLRKILGLKKNSIIVMAIGRLVYKKGFYYLIKAMQEVTEKNPNARLIIGGDGDLKKNLESLSEKMGLKENILFVGNIKRNEIAWYYNLADIFVAPSIVDAEGNVDGGPVVCFESMACGKPQIVTNVLGVADIIEEGKNGYIVEQKNSSTLAVAINKLISSKSLRNKMGIANRELILKTLDTKSVGLRYTYFFKGIINNEK